MMNGYDFAVKKLAQNIEIIPVTETKRPLFKFVDVPKITQAFIDQHKLQYKTAQAFGVLCRGVWCVDIDVGHNEMDNGFQSLEQLPYYDELMENAKNTWVQDTPSGGKHLIFKKREGIDYRQKIGYLPGVDIKAHPNNFFLIGGSKTTKGQYKTNRKQAVAYEGEFEATIFGTQGAYRDQVMDKYSMKNVLYDYDFSHLPSSGKGEGRQAYQRIVDGVSVYRNDDLFKAATYAKTFNIDITPLKVLIGDNKDGDLFSEAEFWQTVNSAQPTETLDFDIYED